MGFYLPRMLFLKPRQLRQKALALDDNLAEGPHSLAFISDLYEWDWGLRRRNNSVQSRSIPVTRRPSLVTLGI